MSQYLFVHKPILKTVLAAARANHSVENRADFPARFSLVVSAHSQTSPYLGGDHTYIPQIPSSSSAQILKKSTF